MGTTRVFLSPLAWPPRRACAQGRRGPPPASRRGHSRSARSPASFKAFLSWARPALGLAALVPSCPAPPLSKALSSSRAGKELSSCASHLLDPGCADAAGSRAALSGLSAPRGMLPRARAVPGPLCRQPLLFRVGCRTCRARRLCSLDGRPRVSATAPSSLRKGPGNRLLAGPAFPSTSLVSRNAASPSGGPPARPLLQEPPVKRVVLTDSPRVSRTFPLGSSRPLRGFCLSRWPPCPEGHPGFVEGRGWRDPSPGGPKAEALGSRGSASGQRAHQRDHRQMAGPSQAVGGTPLPRRDLCQVTED